MLRRTLLLIATTVLATAFLAACNGDDGVDDVLPDGDEITTTDDATPEGEEPDQGAARTDDGDGAGQTGGSAADDSTDLLSERLDVMLVDHEIEMDSTADEGIVAFFVSNEGDEEHGLEVVQANGDNEDILGTVNVAPGEEGQLELELEAGEYIVYCPVGDHREEHGMETTLTVEPVEED
jgi:uncharacterized cupredoxin-like copper-binding protein/predicted small secreted protein